jgi:fosfomycin resistance protein FosX
LIQGVSHLTFIVSDLEKTSAMLSYIFDAKEIYSSGEEFYSLSKEKFFLIGGVWIALMEGPPLPGRSYNHVAFQVDDQEFDAYQEKLLKSGVELLLSRTRLEGEGRSLYFYDFDNHLFELHTGHLSQRIEKYRSK